MSRKNPPRVIGTGGGVFAPSRSDVLDQLLAEVGPKIEEAYKAEAQELGQDLDPTEARADEARLVEQIRFEREVAPERTGRAYHELFDDLWMYAWPVIGSFLKNNNMMRVVWEVAPGRRRFTRSEDLVVLAHSPEERDGLTFDIIMAAIPVFERSVLERRRWHPNGGASLRTWFIGTCGLVYPRVYEKWSAQYREHLNQLARDHDVAWDRIRETLPASVAEPSSFLLDRRQLRRMFRGAQPMTLLIFVMIMSGFTPADISERLRISRKSVEMRIYHFRQKALARQGEAGWRDLLSRVDGRA